MNPHRPARLLPLLLPVLALVACDSKLSKLSDEALQDHVYECNNTFDQAPGFAISCDNFQRECERRREAGHFVC